jgi:HEAT repeat protein
MDPQYLEALEQQLKGSALNLCKAALDELAQIPAADAVPILARVAADPNFLQRRFAIMGLANHRTPEALAVLKQRLEVEPDPNVIGEIANSLFEFGEEGLALLPQIFHSQVNWLVRQSVLSVLIDAGQPQMLLELAEAGLQDPTVSTKETAILALGALVQGDLRHRAIELLLQVAQSDDWRDRWRAATALSRAREPIAQQCLAQLRQDSNHYVVAAALEATL